MRIVTNETLVKRNRKTATYLFFASLTILGVGFFVANGQILGLMDPEEMDPLIYSLIMPAVLLMGFLATIISVRMTNLWIRMPRPEKAILEGLKGLGAKSALYNYYHFPARHVLVSPQGVFAIITRYQDGRFTVKGDKWKHHRSPVGRIFAIFRMDGVGNPTQEAIEAAKYIRYITEDYDPDLEIQPLVIFVDSRANIEIEDPVVPVLHTDSKKEPNLKNYLRDLKKAENMRGPQNIDEFIQEFELATLGTYDGVAQHQEA
jgi:hypothetical protein